jgi:hypothetical protein
LVYFNRLHFWLTKRFHIRDFHNRDTGIPEDLLQNIISNMERAEQESICTI